VRGVMRIAGRRLLKQIAVDKVTHGCLGRGCEFVVWGLGFQSSF
jgi:hypothetical protein